MPNFCLAAFISKAINPFRVFIALMFAVILWLALALFDSQTPRAFASPLRQDCRVCADWNETCSSNGCSDHCVVWVWEPCEGGGDPIPLTVSGAVNCSIGSNGWCVGNTQLNVSASNPQGQAVIISGDVNGLTFACPAGNTTCSVPVSIEGNGIINYRANSASGGSASGAVSYKLDYTTPQIDGSLNGASGTNGWFVSEVDFSASASDVVSGLAALEISIDGGSWEGYGAPITLGDGVHMVSLRAYDNAGNLAETGQTVSVDTLTPLLDISVSGASGSNGWYVSETEISALASDTGSGLFMLEASVDGGAWEMHGAPIILSDGVHTVRFRATDDAGNMTEAGQEVKVDTITPSLTLSVNGTKGLNGWYTSITKASAASSDSGSGVAAIEGAADSGGWATVSALTFSDGLHTYQFRATDNAGNATTVPVQNVKIDTMAPVIDMTEELSLGEALYYSIEDPVTGTGQAGSGLSVFRTVIEDDAEQYKKISWLDSVSGDKMQGDILWNGKFKDGTQAGMGEYFITLKISDAAGNETMKSAVVSVDLLSFFQDPSASLNAIIPGFTSPDDEVMSNEVTDEQATSEQTFGNANSGTTVEKTSSSTSSGGESIFRETTTQVSFMQGSQSTNSPITSTNILWGAAAAALVGATLADWQKKREEEEARRAAAREERLTNGPSTWRQIAMAYQASLDNFRAMVANAVSGGNLSAEDAEQYIKDAKTGGNIGVQLTAMNQHVNEAGLEKKEAARKALEEAARKAEEQRRAEEQRKVEELQAGLMAYYQGRKDGEAAAMPQESWWEKTIDWVDNHQIETSMGVGAIVGLAAIGITLAVVGAVTLPVLLVAAGVAAVAAGVTVAAGTVALNTHYDRPPTTNIVDNVKAATITAAVVSGVGLFITGGLLTQAVVTAGNAIAGTCIANPTVCANAGTILNVVDTLEQVALTVQLTVEDFTGNPHAAETAIELQLEQMDGGVPGNAVAAELGEQIAKLGPDALEIMGKYGYEAIPLLLKYGDDAVDIIGAYGDEGIALLLKFGDEAGEAIKLVKHYGTPAVKVLGSVDLPSAKTLLTTLEGDVLDYAITQGPDAVFALSRWSEKELKEFGPELVLRAKKDAMVLKAIDRLINLGPIDPKNLTPRQKNLIKIIAKNSMQYTDEGQIVLGKWVDYGNGFTWYARETGSVHYNPHPDMWDLFGKLGVERREETTWLVNEQVIQIGVKKGLPFEYTLNGVNPDTLSNEMEAIQVIWSGADDIDILKALDDADRVDIPIRMKELKELYNAHYQFSYDAATNSYILINNT